jgi:hypothetical protein
MTMYRETLWWSRKTEQSVQLIFFFFYQIKGHYNKLHKVKWHEGHKSLLHWTLLANSARRNFFNSALNSSLFLKILMFSFWNWHQVRGRLTRGWKVDEVNLAKGIWIFSLFRSWRMNSCWYLDALLTHTLLNETGKYPSREMYTAT